MKNKLRKQKKTDLLASPGSSPAYSTQHLTLLLQNWMRRCILAQTELQKLRSQYAKLQNELYKQTAALKGVSLQTLNYKNSLKKNNSLLLELSKDVASKAKNTHRYHTSPSNIFQIPSRFTKNYQTLFSEENVRKEKKMRRCDSRKSIFINTKHLNGFIPFPKNLLESDFQVQFSEIYRLNDYFKVIDNINFSYETGVAINWLKTLPVLLVKTISLQFKLCQMLSKFQQQKTSDNDFYQVFETFLEQNINVEQVIIYVADEFTRNLKSRAKKDSMVTIIPYGLGNAGKAAQSGRTVFSKNESSQLQESSTLSVPIFTQSNSLKVVIHLFNKQEDVNEFTDYDQFYVRLLGSSVIQRYPFTSDQLIRQGQLQHQQAFRGGR